MFRPLLYSAGLLTAISISSGAHAIDSFNNIGSLSQSQFAQLSEDLGASMSYKVLSPAEPLGVTGFDMGLELTATQLKSAAVFNTATGTSLDTLPLPKLHIRKGLPLNIDVGISHTPGTISLTGYELSYAILEGGVAMPAVSIRATASKLSGSADISMETQGYELSISKGFTMFTPYAGIGSVKVTTTATGLSEESSTLAKSFYGFNMAFGLLSIAFEGDSTGGIKSYGAKVGFRL